MDKRENREWLYGWMQKDGYYNGNYDDFVKSLNTKEDADRFYDQAVKIGLQVGTREHFSDVFADDKVTADELISENIKPVPLGLHDDHKTLNDMVVEKENSAPIPTKTKDGLNRKSEVLLNSLDRTANTLQSDKLNVEPTFKPQDKIKSYIEEEEYINNTFTPKKENTFVDVLDNIHGRYSLTQEGLEHQRELEELSNKVNDKYINEFKNSDEYKDYVNKQYTSQSELDSATDAINKLYSNRYGAKIQEELAPYYDAYSDAAMNRYSVQAEQGAKKVAKADAKEDVAELNKAIDDMLPFADGNDAAMLKSAKKLSEEAQNIIDEAGKTDSTTFIEGLGRGFWDNLKLGNFSFGIVDAIDTKNLLNALQKAERGEELSDAEEKLLEASSLNMITQAYYSSDLGRGYKAGRVTAESLPFMLEFVANPIAGSGNAIAKGLLKFALKNGMKSATTKAAKFTGRLLGDAAAAASMTATTGLGGVIADTNRRLAGNYKYGLDENGNMKVVKEGDLTTSQAATKAFASRFLENQSEMIFNAFKGWKPFMRVADNELPQGINELMSNIRTSNIGKLYTNLKNSPTMQEVSKRTQWHGIGEEYLEEMYNNIGSVALGDMTGNEAFSVDNNIDTFLGLAPTSVLFGAIGLGGMAKERYTNRKRMEGVYAAATEEQKEKINELRKISEIKGKEGVHNYIKKVLSDKSLQPKDRATLLEAAYAEEVNRAINEVQEAETNEQVSKETEEIRKAANPYTKTYTECTRIIYNAEGEKEEVEGYIHSWIGDTPLWFAKGQEPTKENLVQLKKGDYIEESVVSMPTEEVVEATEAIIREEAAEKAEKESLMSEDIINKKLQNGEQLKRGNDVYTIVSITPDGVLYTVNEGDAMNQASVEQWKQWMQEELDIKESEERIAKKMPRKKMGDGRIIVPTSVHGTSVAYNITDEQGKVLESGEMQESEYSKYEDVEKAKSNESIENTINTSAEIEQNDTTPTEQIEQSVKKPIPTDDKGQPMYYSAPVADTVADLTDGSLDDSEIDGFIANHIKAEKAALEKLKKKVPAIGTDKAKYLEEKKKWQEQVAATEQKVAYWGEVNNAIQNSRKSAIEETIESINFDAPLSGEELAAQMLHNGQLHILRDSFEKETGGKKGERKAIGGVGKNSIFRTKENGGLTIEEAGELLMLVDLEGGTNFFDQNDPNAGRNAIIEVLNSIGSRSELRDYIQNKHNELLAKEREGEEKYYEQMKEEYYADMAYWDNIFSTSLTEEERIEFYNQYIEQLRFIEFNNGKESGTNEQAGASSISSGSNGVLLEEQSDNTNGNRSVEGETINADGRISSSDELAQAGETATEESVAEQPVAEEKEQAPENETILQAAERISKSDKAKANKIKQNIINRINDWIKRGVKINIVERAEDVENKDAKKAIANGDKVAGWYDTDTNEAYIYLPNIDDVVELDKTVLHESISHKGLRELLGEDNFNKLCDKVWESMSEYKRKKYLSYVGTKFKSETDRQRAAADEYMAFLAEKEKLTPREQSIWNKIAQFIRDIFGGNKAYAERIAGEKAVTDKEIAELIRLSYAEYIKNSKQETANEVKDAVEGGTRFRFSKSPEEFEAIQKEAVDKKGIVMPRLNEAVLNIVNVPRHDFTGTGKEAIDKAKEWASLNIEGEHIAKKGTPEEFKYTIDNKSIKKYLSSIATKLSDNLGVHLSVLKMLPIVIDESIEAEIHADYKKTGERSVENGIDDKNLLIHRLYGAVLVDNKLYRVKTTIKEKKNDGIKPYTYEVTKIELIDGSSQNGTSLSNAPINSISAANVLQGVEKSYDKGKKLLDESEKPRFRIVYHGSGAEFDKFNHSFMGTGYGAQSFGWGTYVTEIEDSARNYADESEYNINKRYENGDSNIKGVRTLYVVDIPDNDGTNYLHWGLDNSQEVIDKANKAYFSPEFAPFSKGVSGERIYNHLANELGSDKAASKLLNKNGIVGIQIPIEWVIDNRSNYVIFNENDLDIVEHTRFRKTKEEQSIIDKAKEDGTYMKAPNGKPTNLTEKQWVQVRTKAFKKWFGDWELYAIKKFLLRGNPVASLTGTEFAKVEGKTLTDQVAEYFESIGGKAVSPLFGDVVLDRDGADDSFSHGVGRTKAVAYAAVKEVIENGVLIDYDVNHKDRGYDSAVIAAPIRINKEDYICSVVVKRNLKDNRFYLHEVIEQKKLSDEGSNTVQKQPRRPKAFAKVLQNIVSASDNVSKVVDENGEPLVVRHRTPNEFTEFDKEKIGSSTDYGAFGLGFYFSPTDFGTLYGSNMIESFLNINNPIQLNQSNAFDVKEPFFGANYKWGKEQSERFAAWLKENGYDGVHYENGVTHDEFVAFEPNQIKSATDNVGTFDEGNNDIRFRISNQNQEIFVSNAEKAVEGIKQDKATPQQWLAMIEKNGGIKAGEDKWLGLSDWLNESDAKTLTKDDILNFIGQNKIVIEEVKYGDANNADGFTSLKEEYDQWLREEGFEYAWGQLIERYGDDAEIAFNDLGGELVIENEGAATVLLGGDNIINSTRLDYTTEGLSNKQEIALVVPTVESWNESDEIHFGDAGEGRAIAWVRFGDTTDAYGSNVLVIDEIQSKRHQEGREKGYRTEETTNKLIELKRNARASRIKLDNFTDSIISKYGVLSGEALPKQLAIARALSKANEGDIKKYHELEGLADNADKLYTDYENEHGNISNRVPEAPFEKNWHELAMKRMLRYAAENGFDKVAWTKGAQQAERYDIGESVKSIEVLAVTDSETGEVLEGEYDVYTRSRSGGFINEATGRMSNEQIIDVFGKELGNRIIEGGNTRQHTVIEGEDLRLGGEGMKGFYDKMLPSFVNKYVKKWGTKVQDIELPYVEESARVMHSVDVTDAMKESVMEGQTMFRKSFGGNSGYVGYSMSKRAAEARENGRFPKTDFKKEYGLTDKAFDALVEVGIIDDSEWHHTSKFGNRTTFYGWEEKEYADYYAEHKSDIDKKAREGQIDAIKKEFSAFDDVIEELREEEEKKRKEKREMETRLLNEYKEYRKDNAPTISEEYVASNGVRVVTNGQENSNGWEFYWGDNPAFKKYANEARQELIENIKKSDNRLPYDEWVNEKSETRFRFMPSEQESLLESASKIYEQYKADAEKSNEIKAVINKMSAIIPRSSNARSVTYITDVFRLLFRLENPFEAFITAISLNNKGTLATHLNSGAICMFSKKIPLRMVEEGIVHECTHDVVDYLIDNGTISMDDLKLLVEKSKTTHPDAYRKATNAHYSEERQVHEVPAYIMQELWREMGADCLKESNFADTRIGNIFKNIVKELKNERPPRKISGTKWSAKSERSDLYEGRSDVYSKERSQYEGDYGSNKDFEDGETIQGENASDSRLYGRGEGTTEQGDRRGSEIESGETRFKVFKKNVKTDLADSRSPLIRKVDEMLHTNMFNFIEAFQDRMYSLKVFMDEVVNATGIKLRSFEDAYKGENSLSSKIKIAQEHFLNDFFKPLVESINDIKKKHEISQEEIENYIYCKSGLERNEVLRQRDADNAYQSAKEELDKKLANNTITATEYATLLNEAEKERIKTLSEDKDYSGIRGLYYNLRAAEIDKQYNEGKIDEKTHTQLIEQLRKQQEAEKKDSNAANRVDWKAFAEKTVSDFEKKVKSDVNKLWNKINAATGETLRIDYECGMIDKETYNNLQGMMKYYVPLRDWENNTADDLYSYQHKTSPVTSNQKSAKGRFSQAYNPIVTIASMGQNAIVRGYRNNMKMQFYSFVANRPTDLATVREVWYVKNGNGWDAVHPDFSNANSLDEVKDALDKHDADMKILEAQGLAFRGKLPFGMKLNASKQQKEEHIVHVKINGKEKAVYVNGAPRVAQAINGMTNSESAKDFLSFISKANRAYGARLTSWNPDFIIPNLVRDTIQASTITYLNKGLTESLKYLSNVPSMLYYVTRELGGHDTKYHQYFNEFIENGGETGYTAVNSLDELKKEYNKALEDVKGLKKIMKLPKKSLSAIASWMESVNRIAEDVNRFNAYISSRQSGNDIANSIDAAKNISVNFNRKGAYMANDSVFGKVSYLMSKWALFFNPSVQGLAQIITGAKMNKKRSIALISTIMASGFFMPMLNDILVKAFGGDDEDDYMYQNSYNRRTNWMLFVGDGYVKIPLPHVFSEIYGMGDVFYGLVTGRLRPAQAVYEIVMLMQNAVGFFKLLPEVTNELNAITWTKSFSPDILMPVADVMTNTNFTGAPIAKWTDYNEAEPEYKRVYRGTSQQWIAISKFINDLGANDERRNAFFGNLINPASIEHLVTSYTGGIGTTFNNVVGQIIDHSMKDVEFNDVIRKAPIVKRFYTPVDERTIYPSIRKEYNNFSYRYDIASKALKNYQTQIKNGNTEFQKYIDEMKENGEYDFIKYFKKENKTLNRLNKRLKENPNDKEIEKKYYDKMAEISVGSLERM